MSLTQRPPAAPDTLNTESYTPRSGVDRFASDIDRTEEGHFRGRCLPYVRALTVLRRIVEGPDRVDSVVANLERVWEKRVFNAYYERPFLILAALRCEAMASAQHPLARAFATENPDSLAVTRETLVDALSPARSGVWFSLATRVPQTNEVSRAVTWKWPAGLAGCSSGRRPIGLVDVGASGGLNLIADRLRDIWQDGRGAPLSVGANLEVRLRAGFDIQPLDFTVDRDLAWGRACIFPGNVERVNRFEAAVREWRACRAEKQGAPVMQALNASLVPARLPGLLDSLPRESILFVYQTIVRNYMDVAKRERYEEGMRKWLAGVRPGRAVWLEAETTNRPASLAITAHVPDGSGGLRSITLALTNVHPVVIEEYAQGVADFVDYFKTHGT
jgi:hypothetical protein